MTGDVCNDSTGLQILIVGFFLGLLLAFTIPILFPVSPIYVDCGCGAQAEMARQCFESYANNLTDHWQCGVFK